METRLLKAGAIVSGMIALLVMTGYDCPSCDFVKQTIALATCAIVCLVCSYVAYKKEGKL